MGSRVCRCSSAVPGHRKRREDWECEASLGFIVRPVGDRDPGKEGQLGRKYSQCECPEAGAWLMCLKTGKSLACLASNLETKH